MGKTFKFTLLLLGLAPLVAIWLCVTGAVSPMETAIEKNWPLAVSVLANMGYTDELRRGYIGCTRPVQLAASLGNGPIVDILLDNGATPKAQRCGFTQYGGTTVLEAGYLHPALLTHLVKQRQIDPNLKDLDGNTALSVVLDCNAGEDWMRHLPADYKSATLQSLKTLLDLGTDPDAGPFPPLATAALAGCPEAVAELLQHKADAAAAARILAAGPAANLAEHTPRRHFVLPQEAARREESIRLIKDAAGK
jgi:hypothetical protein